MARVVNVPSNMRPRDQMLIVLPDKYILMPRLPGYTRDDFEEDNITFYMELVESQTTTQTTKWHNIILFNCHVGPGPRIVFRVDLRGMFATEGLVQLDSDHEFYRVQTAREQYTEVLVGFLWFDTAKEPIERLVTNAIYNMPVMREARKTREESVRKRLRKEMR